MKWRKDKLLTESSVTGKAASRCENEGLCVSAGSQKWKRKSPSHWCEKHLKTSRGRKRLNTEQRKEDFLRLTSRWHDSGVASQTCPKQSIRNNNDGSLNDCVFLPLTPEDVSVPRASGRFYLLMFGPATAAAVRRELQDVEVCSHRAVSSSFSLCTRK